MRGGLMMIGAALLLAACDGGDTPEDGVVATGGEVLEGTVSDAMLPTATVTSQPPLAPREPEQREPASAAASTEEGAPSPEAAPAADDADAASSAEEAAPE